MQASELDQEVRRSLLTLSKDTADLVARHLVVAGRLLDDDPEQALVHARAAGALAGRVAVVREAVGLAAYAAGEWGEALSELRAARRMSGSPEVLPVLADCERALGRPERAVALLDDPDVPRLEQATRVELVIVVAGARRDLGQQDAAVLLLQGPARATTARRPWAARLWYAYADALLNAGREAEAREWFTRTADMDADGLTDASDRLLALDGLAFEDTDGEDMDGEGDSAGAGAYDADELRDLVAGLTPLDETQEAESLPASSTADPAAAGAESSPGPAPAVTRSATPEHLPTDAAPGPEADAPADAATDPVTATSPTPGLFSAVPEVVAPTRRPSAVPPVAFVAAEPEGAARLDGDVDVDEGEPEQHD